MINLVTSAPLRVYRRTTHLRRAAGIVGLGMYVPEREITNAELTERLDTSDEWITSRTGIRARRVAAPGEATSDLAVHAAREALEQAGTTAEEIDLILVATATPDRPMPATACYVQRQLGASRAAAVDLGAACTGFLYGLSVARAFVLSAAYRTVLVVGAETLSRYVDWNDRGTAVLMGDGAGAAVVRPVPHGDGILSICLGADGAGADLIQIPAGGSRLPASAETVSGGLHHFTQNGREVYRFATQIMGDACEAALAPAGLCIGDVDLLVPHQANLRILAAAAARFSFPMEKVFVNLDRYGNMWSASVPVALCEAERQGRLRPGSVVLTVAFGAGLTWGASAMRWVGR